MAKKPETKTEEALQAFVPATDFVGYPFGADHPIHFRAGIPSTPVPTAYINSLSEKKTETPSDKG
jgi:hypothetical protein